jgi:hypothetical protein
MELLLDPHVVFDLHVLISFAIWFIQISCIVTCAIQASRIYTYINDVPLLIQLQQQQQYQSILEEEVELDPLKTQER